VPRPPVRAQAAQIIAIIFGLSNNHAALAAWLLPWASTMALPGIAPVCRPRRLPGL
jgi:hypothetical protein